MKNRKTIFLHSMFRAGSTYMFNKFRGYEEFWPYYEPLHHDLIRLKKESLDIWKFDKQATNVMNHPELEKPHFYEFKFAFSDNEKLPYYNINFAYKDFFNVSNTHELHNYIDNLIDSTPDAKLPVFQFNRTSLRIKWFKKQYPESLNIFLLRNPRDQFESYYQRNPIGKNIFLAINLYIVLSDSTANKYLLPHSKTLKFSGDIGKDLKESMNLTKKFDLKKHYEIFYYIWSHSLAHADQYANIIMDMDKMNSDKDYIVEIQNKISNYSSVELDFNDYNLKQNVKYSMKKNDFNGIENKINNDIEYDISSYTDYEYPEDIYEIKADGILSNLLIRLRNMIRAK